MIGLWRFILTANIGSKWLNLLTLLNKLAAAPRVYTNQGKSSSQSYQNGPTQNVFQTGKSDLARVKLTIETIPFNRIDLWVVMYSIKIL